MPKRLATTFFVTIGIALACVVVFALVLILAPGLSIFGFKYIAKGTHIVNSTTVLSEKVSGFSGSVKIEVEDVRVDVVFSSSRSSYQIEYYDNYNGFTNSRFDDPSIAFSSEADGTAVVKITSFKKFLYENYNSARYVRLIIPATTIASTKPYQTNLTIISKNSKVNFYDEKSDHYDPCFKNIDIQTSGKVTSSTNVKAINYKLKTSNSIKISGDQASSINATNYDLESTGGKIVIDREVSGNIVAKTKNSKIQVLACNNLTASSGTGSISSTQKDKQITVNGTANITTTSGSVKIGSILGQTEKSVIQTKTGLVEIDKAQDIDITTTRGFVTLNSARNANIITSSGAITLKEATASVIAKSKRGKVTLGGEGAVLRNPSVETTYGAAYVESASGRVDINTSKADVVFKNKDASNIKIVSGKKLTATKLIGSVEIEVADDSTISFERFTAKSTIVGTNKKSTITINMLNNDKTTFSYDLEGEQASLYEYNVNSPSNHYHIATSTNITSSNEAVGQPLLKASTVGKLVVYYKRSSI